MKKLLLLLLLSLSFTGSTYADAICKDGWKSTSEGSGTCSHHLGVCEWKPNYTYNAYSNDYNPSHIHGYNQCPSGGGTSDFYFNPLDVESSQGYGNTNLPMIMAYEGAYGMTSALAELAGFQVQDEEGSVINDISNAIAEGIANEKASKAISSPPNSYRSAAGVLKCINGYYKTGNACKKIPENAHSSSYGLDFICNTGYVQDGNTCQKEYIQKKEDKPKVADKTTTSSSKSSTNKSVIYDLLDFLLGALIIFLIAWYIFKDALAIFFPSLKRYSFKRLYKWLTRRRK